MKPSTIMFASILAVIASSGVAVWLVVSKASAINIFILCFNLISLVNLIIVYIRHSK